jgi:hypothetical protein
MRSRSQTWCAVVFAVLVAVAAAAVVRLASQPTDYLYEHLVVDDAIYYVKPALNLLAGHGYSFDGVYRTNGVQPLWAMVVVGLLAVLGEPAPVVHAMVLLSGLLWLAGGVVLYHALSRLSPLGALLGGTTFLLAGMESRLAMWGMENGLHAFLLAITLWQAHRVARLPVLAAGRPRALCWLGFATALLALTRVEFGLFAVLLGCWLLLAGREPGQWRAALRRTLPFTLPLVGLGVAWLLVSRLYFGEWTPISGSVKAWNSLRNLRPMGLLERCAEVLEHVVNRGLSGLWLTAVVILLFCVQQLTRWWVFAVLGATLAPLLVGALALWRRLASARPLRSGGIAIALAAFLVVHVVLLAEYLTEYAGYCGWYVTGEVAAVSLLVGGLAGSLRGLHRLWAVPTLLLLAASFVMRVPSWFHYERTWVTQQFVATGRWLEHWLPPGATIGAQASGYVALEARSHRVVNLDGLINDGRYLRQYLMQDRIPDYFRDERIGYVADYLPAEQWRRYLRGELRDLPDNLRPLHCWPSGKDWVVGVFATGLGDPALPAAPAHPLAALRVRALVLGEHPLVADQARAGLASDQVIASTFVVPPRDIVHVVVPRDRLAGVVDAAGFARLRECDLRFADRVALRAVEPPAPVAAGDRLVLTSYWQALSKVAAGGPLSLCLQVAGVESCSGPALGTLPVEHWPAGLLLPHAFVVELPADLPAGTYPLRIDVRDGAVRSLGVDGGAAPVSLGDLQVVAR